jgi:hypothetical protein
MCLAPHLQDDNAAFRLMERCKAGQALYYTVKEDVSPKKMLYMRVDRSGSLASLLTLAQTGHFYARWNAAPLFAVLAKDTRFQMVLNQGGGCFNLVQWLYASIAAGKEGINEKQLMSFNVVMDGLASLTKSCE